jgi:hypothetical protein
MVPCGCGAGRVRSAGLPGGGLRLQYLPAQAAMLTLAAAEAVGELWQARWPGEPAVARSDTGP